MAINVTRINNDSNGNPRNVVHFLDLLTRDELDSTFLTWAGVKYQIALERAKIVGGRKYHNKSYGGGIVFQEYDSMVEGLVKQAFTNLENNKDYINAHNQIYLVVVNDFKLYTECLNSMKDCLQRKITPSQAFGKIFSVCETVRHEIRTKYKVRVTSNAVWWAAIMVCLDMETTTKENQG